MWWALGVVLSLGALYLGGCFLVARVSVRPPRVPLFLSPGLLGAPQETVRFEGREGLMLVGWWMDQPSPGVVAVMTHGYCVNRSEPAPVAHWLWRHGAACLMFDFPAHGDSQGREVGFGWKERLDVLAALRIARARYPAARIVLWGSSLGAAAGAFACAEAEPSHRPSAMILDCPYGRLSRAIDGWWKFVGGRRLARFLVPVAWFSRVLTGLRPRRIDVAAALAACPDVPALVISGARDTILPPDEARRLEAASPSATLVTFEGCHHSEPRYLQPDRYREALETFLRDAGCWPGD